MSELKEFKCPACGGTMEFDSKSQKMKCPYCDTELDVSQMEQAAAEENPAQNSQSGNDWQCTSEGEWSENDGMNVYICQSCGGEILADETTGASTCPYCGNRVVMKEKFSGDLKPDYIIPFKYDKKQAKEAYKKHLEKKQFLPKVFKDENHIDEIKGIYVPFWLYDMDANADMEFKAERIRNWSDGDYEYTEINSYKCYRSGSISVDRLPCDGSEKMDDTLMESVEPFDFKDAVPFKSAYMAGYMADRYDVDMSRMRKRAEERAGKTIEENIRRNVAGYDTVIPQRSNVNILNASYSYALYPVWILNTSWNGEKYTFAMNGQTGKMVGNLPVDKKAFWLNVALRTGIFSAAVYAATALFMLL